MRRDTLVIDIETKNTFAEVGRNNFDALEVSIVGIYSYLENKFFSVKESEFKNLEKIFKNAELLVGFCISNFDLPVLRKHVDLDLFAIPRVDLLDEIEILLGRRIGLDLLAKANLGFGKNGNSLDAPILYKEGKIEELEKYCLNDVKITKDLYELARNRGYLMVPQRNSSEMIRADIGQSFVF